MSRDLMNIRKTDRAVQKMWEKVLEVRARFEGRWMMLSLHRVDPELYKNLMEQNDIFDDVSITGSVEDVEEHGNATIRGYEIAIKRMEKSEVEDDSYILGQCYLTGLKIAIGSAKGSTKRIREVYGQDVIFISPDEVASIIAMKGECESKVIAFIHETKKLFPGAELIVRRYAEEGT